MSGKPLHWLGSSRTDIRAFPRDARRIAGVELRRVQQGLDPLDWKPMTSVGPGVREIRVHTGLEHRVVYVAKFAEAIYVLHVFENARGRRRRGMWTSRGNDSGLSCGSVVSAIPRED